MADLLSRIAGTRKGERGFSADQWLNDYLIPSYEQFGYSGKYPFGLNQTYAAQKIYEVSADLPGHASALRTCPPAFAAQMVRALVISQARFTYRNPPYSPTPRRTFGNSSLSLLERPWTNATTANLVSRMEWHAGLAGNAYVLRQGDRLRMLRPDWVAVLWGSASEPDDALQMHALDGEIVGYVYANGGFGNPNARIQTLLPRDIAHWAPIPDPESAGVGMSWITPAVRDIQGDLAATTHKLNFFKQGATPNLVVKGIPAATKDQFDDIVEMMESNHAGVRNAYKTLYLTAGADVSVVGADLKQLDFKQTQGAGETRISLLSRVPAPLLGISEGLAGSSLNAGNFGMARRIFSDSWVYPTLQGLCSALGSIVDVPADAELWFDVGDIPLLREDGKDAAEIEQIKAQSIRALVDGGFEPTSVVAAVQAGNMNLLKHSGFLSVQLQEPGAITNNPGVNQK